ncbi:MAG: NAD-dependent malic enzyme [Candidatus Binatia bacterium]|nr:NAD-dependent malic enzyme [Candidatus Binatia bacterium]MDG1960476.1 NAD-dependent malic enzyme [Candidatus Binatia bacterium]MDG2009519.1 NAD-dependent malic enzyme [Candidatus Binatia bacterium]
MKNQVNTLRGRELIDEPLGNKGTAFSEDERAALGLYGLLPPHVDTLEDQVRREYDAYSALPNEEEKHVFLRNIQDTNEVLFYRLVVDHLAEMMPIIYTPTVGLACQRFSEIYARPRGIFIPYPHRDRMEEMLRNYDADDIEAIVVTDGERILGLGDQGTGGMGIPIGKLSLYVAVGGIHPSKTLPVCLDVGTNNQERLDDPHYIGWREKRITGDEYIAFVDQFVAAVKKIWPHVLLQFEDFAFQHATPLLARYRDQLCMFNDDVQGTASVALGTVLSAVEAADSHLKDQTVAILGGGSAGCGIAEQIIAGMVEDGLSEQEARGRLYMVDVNGLLEDNMKGLSSFQQKLAQPGDRLKDWKRTGKDQQITLADVARQAKPTILIGVCGHPNLFTEEIIRCMAENTKRPIVFPLSNPTSRIEAAPSDIIEWTDGQALIATGSPIDPVTYKGKTYPIAQCNNTYIFPAFGLGVVAGNVTRVSDEMFREASRTLASCAASERKKTGALLPPLPSIREVSKDIAFAVASKAQEQGHAPKTTPEELRAKIEQKFWDPAYDS